MNQKFIKLFRRCKYKAKKVFDIIRANEIILSSLLAILGIILAINSNKYAKQSNTLSETALNLSKNDKSQQIQIDRLKDILVEIKSQNEITKVQTAQLISLNKEANQTNNSTRDLISRSATQTLLLSKELELLNKNDSISALHFTMANESDLLILRKIFDEISNIETSKRVMWLTRENKDYSVIRDIRSILEKGMNNKIFLNDKELKQHWYSYYLEVKYIELMLGFSPQNHGSLTENQASELTKAFETFYLKFINFMFKKFKKLEVNFENENYIPDYTDTINLN